MRMYSLEQRPESGREAAYLRSIVLNLTRSWMRRKHIRERLNPLPAVLVAPVEERCLRLEQIQTVRDAVATLPDRQQQVLALRFGEDLNEAAIAAQLGISCGSVKTHAYRSRRSLAKALGSVAAHL